MITTSIPETTRKSYLIPPSEFRVGQRLRPNGDGEGQVIVRVIETGTTVTVDVASVQELLDGASVHDATVGVITFPAGSAGLTTFLEPQTGMIALDDSGDARCGTCDSRRCDWNECLVPWAFDTMTVPA